MKKNNLDTLREKIDKIDKDILKLIQKRGNLAINVGSDWCELRCAKRLSARFSTA